MNLFNEFQTVAYELYQDFRSPYQLSLNNLVQDEYVMFVTIHMEAYSYLSKLRLEKVSTNYFYRSLLRSC